ncbi:MAG: polar amino acid transport system substrate-binding protein [Verrucomicrobiales bacterium]|jgi:polar amino acid transport system substrate-binding protein
MITLIRRAGLALFLLVASLTACGNDTNATLNAADDSSLASSVLDTVTESGTIRIGVRNDNPPMSFINEDGEWVGFDLELAQAVAEQIGAEVELVPVDGTTRISFLDSGQVDISVASMNHTRSRDEAVDFSITYFWDNQSFLVRTDSYASIDELFGQTVAANAGSSVIGSWNSYVAEAGGDASTIVEFADKLAALQALRDGAVEGYSEDNITLLALAAGDPTLTLLPGGHNPVQFGIGVPENDSEWRDTVNLALQEVWKDGSYQELYDRWFVNDTKIIDLPLGGEMEIWG